MIENIFEYSINWASIILFASLLIILTTIAKLMTRSWQAITVFAGSLILTMGLILPFMLSAKVFLTADLNEDKFSSEVERIHDAKVINIDGNNEDMIVTVEKDGKIMNCKVENGTKENYWLDCSYPI